MTKENPLAGIDDMLTQYAFTVSEHHSLRITGQPRLAAQRQGEAKALREQIRGKVAQANLIINELIELKQDKEKT